MTKDFMPSLSVESQAGAQGIRAANVERLRSHPVLILVTGKWAQEVSIESFLKVDGDIDRLPSDRFNHLERLGDTYQAESCELSKAYRKLEYHCTVATYEQGADHAWGIQGVSCLLSDMVILPRLLQPPRLKGIMGCFNRALKKTLRDSLILAGQQRHKEDTWELKPLQLSE